MRDTEMPGTASNSLGDYIALLPGRSEHPHPHPQPLHTHIQTPRNQAMNAWPQNPPRELVGRLFRQELGHSTASRHHLAKPPFQHRHGRRRESVSDRPSRSRSSIVTCIRLSVTWQPCGEGDHAACYTSHLNLLHRADKGSRCQAKNAHLPSRARHWQLLHNSFDGFASTTQS